MPLILRDCHIRFYLATLTWSSYKNEVKQKMKNLHLNEDVDTAAERSTYIIRSSNTFLIKYPKGASPVLYIGEGYFPERVKAHIRNWLEDFIKLTREGVEMYVFLPRVQGFKDAYQRVETDLLDDFQTIYGCLPLQNSIKGAGNVNNITYANRSELATYFTAGRGKRYKWSIIPTQNNRFGDVYTRGMQSLINDGEE